MDQENYDVFISYSRDDYVDNKKNIIPGNVVSIIKKTLKDAGISYWMDEDGLSGYKFSEVIAEYIKRCKLFLFISTANSNKSEWTSDEIATARAYKKTIIPIKCDDSEFNSSYILYIAKLDYVEYYVNPEKALAKLRDSIKAYLETFSNQEELVNTINKTITRLRIGEEKIKLDREDLLLEADKIKDKGQQEALKKKIVESSPIRKEYLKKMESLKESNENLEIEKESITRLLAEKDIALKDKDATLTELKNKLSDTQQSSSVKLSSAKQEIEQIRLTYEKLQNEKQQLEQKVTETEQQLKTAKVDLSRISDRQKAYQTRINNLEKENSDLFIAVEKYKKQLGQMHHYHPSVWRIVLLGVVIGSVICSILFFIVNSCVGHDTTNSDLVSGDSVVKKAVAIDFYSVVDSSVAISYGPESKRVYKYTGIVSSKSKLPEGRGEAKYNDGSVYNGCFKNGLSDDSISAVLTFEDGDFFKGTFSKGYYVKGIYTYKDKSYYEGTYKNGKKDNGVFCEKDASPRYFKNGVEVTGSAALQVKRDLGI